MQSFKAICHPVELELKKKKDNVKKAYQTYLNLVDEAAIYHTYVSSLLTGYSGENEKEVHESSKDEDRRDVLEERSAIQQYFAAFSSSNNLTNDAEISKYLEKQIKLMKNYHKTMAEEQSDREKIIQQLDSIKLYIERLECDVHKLQKEKDELLNDLEVRLIPLWLMKFLLYNLIAVFV